MSVAKRNYYTQDLKDWCDYASINFQFPSSFPLRTVLPLRATIASKSDPATIQRLCKWSFAWALTSLDFFFFFFFWWRTTAFFFLSFRLCSLATGSWYRGQEGMLSLFTHSLYINDKSKVHGLDPLFIFSYWIGAVHCAHWRWFKTNWVGQHRCSEIPTVC